MDSLKVVVGTWLRLRCCGDLLGSGSDVFFDGVAPYGTRDCWRIGSPLAGLACVTNRLLVGAEVRSELENLFDIKLLQMERLIVVDAGLEWSQWGEEEFADKAWAWASTHGMQSVDDLTERSPRDLNANVVLNPPLWQVLGHVTETVDSAECGCIWDPVYNDGHRVLLRPALWERIREIEARFGRGRLRATPFFLPDKWNGVHVPTGGWRRP